ncbi:sulfite exporter TauE/SafE family protein [Desulfogranum marinum]|uniref:sulfite exporter TauE/SafE family protein n=1 Tax=Desulfogranum marinum TaxID=453220 RepID=UPI0019665188|nr:sulfite exporter TauE/SafE family protein [Desulfogranum marinum]MBM9514468.1 sulfite exporter TauE/SafE family protein [Desulfogranum marinum]
MTSIASVETLLLLFVSFLVGGLVKGIIGTGLPTIALALLTATIGIKEGMAIILLPSILTNIQQGVFGGYFKAIVFRSWSFFLATFCTIWLGAFLLQRVDVSWLSALLGCILFLYALFGLSSKELKPPGQAEQWLNPLIGAINGLLTGMTGSAIVPGVLYLQSLAMEREKLIQTMGLVFLVSTITLAFALQKNKLLTGELLLLSAISFLPAYLGMLIGNRLRRNISEQLFRKLFFSFMLLLGCYIVARSFFTH